MNLFRRSFLAVGLAVLVGWLAFPAESVAGSIVVANRDSADLSVIDVRHDIAVTVPMPMEAGDNVPEPMYVVNTTARNRVFVGDRANDRVVVFRGHNMDFEAYVPAGAGVFHMWADRAGKQLWVVNDMDLTVTVIDPRRLTVLATVDMPADLSGVGAKPHDVTLSDDGSWAYVTFLGVPGTDVVVQFDTEDFEEVNRIEVGMDPHLSYNNRYGQLYVPCQGTGEVYVLGAETLDVATIIPIPGAHGAITSTNDQRFYTTNLPGGGIEAVFAVDTYTNTVVAPPADTPFSVPHNLALTPNGRKLYVTHSGANDRVSVFAVTNRDPAPILLGTVQVGTNPFGLAYVR